MKFTPGALFVIGLVFAGGLAVGMLAPKKEKAAPTPTPPDVPPVAPPKDDEPGPLPPGVLVSELFGDENGVDWSLYGYADGTWKAVANDASPGYLKAFASMDHDGLVKDIQAYAATVWADGSSKVGPAPPVVGATPVFDTNSVAWIIQHLADGTYHGMIAGGMSPYGVYGDTPEFHGSTVARVQSDINEWSAEHPLAPPAV